MRRLTSHRPQDGEGLEEVAAATTVRFRANVGAGADAHVHHDHSIIYLLFYTWVSHGLYR